MIHHESVGRISADAAVVVLVVAVVVVVAAAVFVVILESFNESVAGRARAINPVMVQPSYLTRTPLNNDIALPIRVGPLNRVFFVLFLLFWVNRLFS